MKPEEITALAREYAEEECNKSTMIDTSNLYEDKLLEFYDVYGFLLRRYCLVEKGKLEAKYKEVLAALESNDNEDVKWGTYRLSLLDHLFPDLGKEVEE